MALTQEQWLEKIRSFVPTWWFESEENQIAHAYALAELMRQIEIFADAQIAETYISTSSDGTLDDHGAERSIERLDNEYDAQYQIRVRSLKNISNKVDLKKLVDQLLMIGESEIKEDFESDIFVSRDAFINRREILINDIVNVFSVIVNEQKHDPYSFLDREYFCDREDYCGTNESSQYVFDLLLEALDKSKAEGTNYRIIERIA